MITKSIPGHISEEQIYLFHEGTNYKSYKMLGAHLVTKDRMEGVRFSVWAPNAQWVSVIGDFNEWNIQANPMTKRNSSGVWELFIPGVKEHMMYKYAIGTFQGEVLYKYDPYAYYAELRPKTASIVYNIDNYCWGDEEWQTKRSNNHQKDQPMMIYEVHLGSWKQKEGKTFLTYRELAHELVDYVTEMGYTHIELLPIMEHPHDGSWGYQVLGYYAVTSRYGTPEDFMYFVDRCHQNGIGVLLDWVPGHFPKDAHGLARFDGTALYEHLDPRQGEHPQWGTLIYNYGRREVQSFLISSAVFWLENYHVDGFRVDAVTSILYLDYARTEWIPNQYGGNENLEAASFLRRLNETIDSLFPNILMIAEDSSQWPMVTGPTSSGGLGFDYKWNMGWMNDTLKYCNTDPFYRKWNHHLLTFSLTYAFSEKFILPLSHDEVVHGKASLLSKMPGEYEMQFAGLRTLFGYMMAHPGKKLVFMGAEFGQFIEWNYDAGLDWFLLDYDRHQKTKDFVKALNHFYRINPSLWEDDNDWSGFQWIIPDDSEQSVLVFLRKGYAPGDYMLVAANFTLIRRHDYRIGVPKENGFIEVFNTNEIEFGGTGSDCKKDIKIEMIPSHGFEQSIEMSIPPLSVIFFKPKRQEEV